MADKRFRAFISYSQKDKAIARRIQRWLETYRLPKGAETGGTRRLGRFFRDDEEMSASADVGATLRGAIEDSENLIVVSSPHAARSRWVNAEIQHFRRTGRGDRIFAVIVDGVPNSGDPATECLPHALKAGDWDGLSMPLEPLALDVRTESKARVRTRLAAGLLNVSFDDLWKREQRRYRLRVIQWSAACLAIVGTLGVLGLRLLDARRTATARERAGRLADAVSTLGDSAPMAVGTVRDLLKSDGEDQAAADVARVILSWAKGASEIPAGFPLPRLFTEKNQLFLYTKTGWLAIGDAAPKRRIGFSVGRLIVFYDRRIVSIDSRSGKVLDTMNEGPNHDLPWFVWEGLAFEGADGTGIVAARHTGVSMGLWWDALLTVSPTGTLSLVSMPDLSSGAAGANLFSADEIIVAPACDELGMIGGSPATVEAGGRTVLRLRIQDGLQVSELTDTMPGARLTLLPSRNDADSWRQGIEQTVDERGCKNPGFDSAGSHGFTGLGGLVLAGDLGTSPASPSEWRQARAATPVTRDANPQPWELRTPATDRSNPCARGCRTTDKAGRQEDFDGEFFVGPGWVHGSLPPEGLSAGPVAEQLAKSPLYTFHEQHNQLLQLVWCRRIDGVPLTCITRAFGGYERRDLKEIDLQAKSGRFLLYANGFDPFEVFDLRSMRNATPTGNQLASQSGAAVFSSGPDDRLFVFAENRLSAFEPDATSGRFVDISGAVSWQRRLAGIDGSNPVIAVTSPTTDELIAASENGLLVRFEWRTGRTLWSRQITGIGKLRAIRRAPAGAYVALVGERGIRIVRTRDGLFASGALLPPYLFDPAFDTSACADGRPVSELIRALTDVAIADTGTLTVSCGAAHFAWTAQPYSGHMESRLDALLTAPARVDR